MYTIESLMRTLLAASLAFLSTSASSIVIRDDVEDAKYRVSQSEYTALADMPGEGHGVLIAPQWVITVAHAVTWQSQVRQVIVNGVPRDVERLVIHPGYKPPPRELQKQGMESWDWTLFRTFLASSADIALIKLTQPVKDVAPAAIAEVGDEYGRVAKIFGKGATGNGATGYQFTDRRRTELRRSYNRVSSAHGAWFCFVFNEPSVALPLEGGSGSGDSGGPVLVQLEGGWGLAGLTSWVDAQSTHRTPGRYGQVTCNVRLSHYKSWIESVIGATP